MDSFYFEERRKEYLELSSKEKSVRKLLFELISFLKELLSQENDLLKEVYVLETIPELIPLVEIYSSYGVEPNKTEDLIETVKKLNPFIKYEDSKIKIEKQILRINNELKSLQLILVGKDLPHEISSLSFPVLERTVNNSLSYGMVEQLEISIHSNKKNNKLEFNLIPSLPTIDEKLKKQIDNSWKFATGFVKSEHHKIKSNLEVTIRFVNKLGIYEGDSLGVALTVGFIQELFRYYDLREEISYENNIITTGSMNEEGQIGSVGGEIIRTKVLTAFYSKTNKFIVPLDDLNSAIEVLNTLNEKFPKRKLAIIPMQNINDVINRRDIVGIEKQNIVRWGSKKLVKNKIAVSLAIILATVLLSFYYINQDKNPASIEMLDGKIFIKNKVNKVLWSKDYSACTEKILNVVSSYPYNKCRIIDVDNDGKNEVLVALSEGSKSLSLYNSIGEVIWEYSHTDSLGTKDEKFTGQFGMHGIIDTIHANGKIELLIYFQHYNYYPTGIAKLDLLTGEKISDVLWHPGAIGGAVLVDWNKDGKKEIIAGGASNGMHKAYLFSIDHDKLNGTFPTSENYTFINKQLAEFNNYILFSQTDYGQHFFPKYNAVQGKPEIVNHYLSVRVFEGKANLLEADFSYGIRFNKMLEPIQSTIGDKFVVFRDKLINDGILNPPYTDTPEFHDSILNGIEYWNGKKFVKYLNP